MQPAFNGISFYWAGIDAGKERPMIVRPRSPGRQSVFMSVATALWQNRWGVTVCCWMALERSAFNLGKPDFGESPFEHGKQKPILFPLVFHGRAQLARSKT